jgi:hypothetical protein
MKLRVEQWERVWTEGRHDYEDVYHDLGVKNVTIRGNGDDTIARLDDLLITSVFGLQVNDDYIEFGGFIRSGLSAVGLPMTDGRTLYVQYRLFTP